MPAAANVAGAERISMPAQVEMLRTTRWDAWRHGEFWAARLKQQAHVADHLITVSPHNRDTAISMLGIEPENVTAIPNGVDIERFRPRPRRGARRDAFRRALVEDPQGWTESGPPGTLAYTETDLDRLLGVDDDAIVLLYVGRFLGFKRVPALIRAFARARSRFTRPGSLVIWGGHPGEWEGEHPATVAEEVGTDGIYFAGWRGHDDLPAGLAACDALVVPSVDDPYPQVPLEAMAVGLPWCVPQRWPRLDGQPRPRPSHRLVGPPGRSRRPHRRAHDGRERPSERAGRGANARRTPVPSCRGTGWSPLRGGLRPRHRTSPTTRGQGGQSGERMTRTEFKGGSVCMATVAMGAYRSCPQNDGLRRPSRAAQNRRSVLSPD